jgi:hypothetical protein
MLQPVRTGHHAGTASRCLKGDFFTSYEELAAEGLLSRVKEKNDLSESGLHDMLPLNGQMLKLDILELLPSWFGWIT